MRIKMLSILIAMMVALPVSVFAVELDVSAGTTPDSPLYQIDVWWDDMRVNMARNNLEKSRLRIEIAEERAAEMQEMIIKKDEGALLKAQAEHKKQLGELAKTSLENDVDRNRVQERLQKHIMNLERVMEGAPKEAKPGLVNALQNANVAFEKKQIKISLENKRVSLK